MARVDAFFLKNRELFYAWSRRIWELYEELDLLRKFFEQKKVVENMEGFESSSHLPGTYRGGMVARLQRRLKMDERGCFRPARED